MKIKFEIDDGHTGPSRFLYANIDPNEYAEASDDEDAMVDLIYGVMIERIGELGFIYEIIDED